VIIRTYICVECGKHFESSDEILEWMTPRCDECDHDDRYMTYGPEPDWNAQDASSMHN
jgi:DNA-directed RNA polymerase subunit RPC12/RpoP